MQKVIDTTDFFFKVPVPSFTLKRKQSTSSVFGALLSLLFFFTGIVYLVGRLLTISSESDIATLSNETFEGFYGLNHEYYMSRLAFGLQYKSGQNTLMGLNLTA